jgi:transposase
MNIEKNTEINFTGQSFYVGIDVHKKQWYVTIRSNSLELKTFSMEPKPNELRNYLERKYPKGNYYSVYEAGFCGFWIDEKLKGLGINNIVVNAADVPTRSKEKLTKTDKVDSRKLARELENGTLEGIYIPTRFQQELRSLCRLRHTMVKESARIKNRIKGMMNYYGIELPPHSECYHWSGRFIKYLEEVRLEYSMGNDCLGVFLEELKQTREKILKITRRLRQAVRENDLDDEIRKLYSTVPGVGWITAITLYTEIIDMKRFTNMEKLAGYVGLVPTIKSSGEKETVLGLTIRNSKYLRRMLIESSWVAIKEDEAMYECFCNLIKRMDKKRAIISIARKLLSRIRHVWLKQEEYVYGVII